MAALDPDLPLRRLQSADARIEHANYQEGVLGSMLGFLALLGLGLASLGIYGVIAWTMAQRTSEFGIRLALGARVSDITRLVLASGAKLALSGAGLGLLGAVGIEKLLAASFPALPMRSVSVLTAVTLLLVAVALIASGAPARSAGRIDPNQTLKAE